MIVLVDAICLGVTVFHSVDAYRQMGMLRNALLDLFILFVVLLCIKKKQAFFYC